MIKVLLFDWGDTLMVDFKDQKGTMAYWTYVEMIPHIDDALNQLKASYKCSLASNAGDSNVELLRKALARVNIDHYFDNFFISSDLGVSKPNPDFYTQIVANLNVNPDECIMIGNDYMKDIAPAKIAGLRTIWFTQESTSDSLHADILVNSMSYLVGAVSKLNMS